MNKITVETIVNAPMAKVWDCWNKPEHIPHWAFASDDWEAYGAENDLRTGGMFKTTMAAKDKSASFDFGGVYTAVKQNELIEYDMNDKRHVTVVFTQMPTDAKALAGKPEGVKITETFDPENDNTEEMQKKGWQAIMDNFKKYVERS